MEIKKAWQKGFSLKHLQEIAGQFAEYNELSCSPFSEMAKNSVASALHKDEIEFVNGGIIQTGITKSNGTIKCHQVLVGSKRKDDRIIYKISGNRDSLVERISLYKEPTWLYVWEESEKYRNIALDSGFKKIGAKVSSYGEIQGVYFKDVKSGLDILYSGETIQRTQPVVDKSEKYALRKLLLNKNKVRNLLLSAKKRLANLPSFTNHYSNYNKGDSWSALSLRGFQDDPSFIAKPREMNSKWMANNYGWWNWKIRNTPLFTEFPEIKELMEMLPGEKERIRFMKLAPEGGELERHTDQVDKEQGIADGFLARLHFPIITNEDVLFEVWDWDGNSEPTRMMVGECWYLDVRKPHRAVNGGNADRIHLVVDVVSNSEFRRLL